MTFREKFFGGQQQHGEHAFGRGCLGLEPKPELLEELRTAVRTLLESSVERVQALPGGGAFVSEIQYQLGSLAESGADSPEEWDGEAIRPPSDLEVADAIQRHCNYLGSQLCGIRWAAERRVSERSLRIASKSMESLYRQDFQSGIRLYDTREYILARESFQRALACCPTNYFAHQYLGLISAHIEMSTEALSHFESAFRSAETDGHRALALSHLARAHYALGNLGEAVALSRKAVELDDGAAFWYEYGTYSALQGDIKPVLPAIIAAMQKDWVFWSIAVVDPQLDLLRGEITATMNDVRDRIGRKSKQMLDQLRELCEGMRQLGGLDIGPLQKEIEEYDLQYAQNNIYVFRDLVSRLESVLRRVIRSARETVHDKIAARRRGLRKTDVWREQQVVQLSGPVHNLRREQRALGSSFEAWNAGCLTYTAIWTAYTFIVASFIEKPGDIAANVVPYLFGFIIPFVLPAAVNGFNYWLSVKLPCHTLERRIKELETKVNPAVETIEKEYSTRKETIARELDNLETLMERIRRTEAAA